MKNYNKNFVDILSSQKLTIITSDGSKWPDSRNKRRTDFKRQFTSELNKVNKKYREGGLSQQISD